MGFIHNVDIIESFVSFFCIAYIFKVSYRFALSVHIIRQNSIFGKDLLDDEEMLTFLDGLVCKQFDKPFECIGTRDEINCALSKAVEKYGEDLPLLLRVYKEKYYTEKEYNEVENFFDT